MIYIDAINTPVRITTIVTNAISTTTPTIAHLPQAFARLGDLSLYAIYKIKPINGHKNETMFSPVFGSLSISTSGVISYPVFCLAPHFGQVGADSAIISPHSLQCTNAIYHHPFMDL